MSSKEAYRRVPQENEDFRFQLALKYGENSIFNIFLDNIYIE